ncbi:MAG TPA: Uma2 family endonuclease [Burkholderiales bacterium]|nr:Uma2 family endonuclease [Burkholderiales bacterium]
MSAIPSETPLLSVEEYLEAELASEIKHEYFGGRAYAMSGASVVHNQITLNLAMALRQHLKSKPCQVFMADVKVRLRVAAQDVFYYPDVFVACRADDREKYYRRHPNTIIEVLSEATERTDRREKFLAYQTIESLKEYVLVGQAERQVTVFRRDTGWEPEHFNLQDALTLPSLEFSMPVAEVYAGAES